MSQSTRVENLMLSDGVRIGIESRAAAGYQDVGALDALSFSSITAALERIGEELNTAMKRMEPTKAAVEFGIEVGVESGRLTTLICQGKTTANFTIKLEWDRTK